MQVFIMTVAEVLSTKTSTGCMLMSNVVLANYELGRGVMKWASLNI